MSDNEAELYVVQYRNKGSKPGTIGAGWVTMPIMSATESRHQAKYAEEMWEKEVRVVRIAGEIVTP